MTLDAIGIVAADITNAIKFYSFLGLDFSACEKTDSHVEATTKSGLRVMIDSEALMKELNPQWIKPEGQRMTLAFLCQSPDEVNKTYEKIIQSGYRGAKEPWDAFWGQRYASVIDPDGNTVDIFAPL